MENPTNNVPGVIIAINITPPFSFNATIDPREIRRPILMVEVNFAAAIEYGSIYLSPILTYSALLRQTSGKWRFPVLIGYAMLMYNIWGDKDAAMTLQSNLWYMGAVMLLKEVGQYNPWGANSELRHLEDQRRTMYNIIDETHPQIADFVATVERIFKYDAIYDVMSTVEIRDGCLYRVEESK